MAGGCIVCRIKDRPNCHSALSLFSWRFSGEGKLLLAETVADLQQIDATDSIILLANALTHSPLMPKNYPFYYPDEHKTIIDILEEKAPRAIVALTGRHPMCGLDPFPLFEDGNFTIPVAYTGQTTLPIWRAHAGEKISLTIDSHRIPGKARQLVATKKGQAEKKVVVGAHMDTKYHTPGALDNGAGVAVLLAVAEKLVHTDFNVDIVPFNGEEHYAACGELAYMEYLSQLGTAVELMVNIDSPCYKGARTAVSFYNLSEKNMAIADQTLVDFPMMVAGEPWYAGDHAPFVFSGIPCIAVTTADFENALAQTHTENDTLQIVDQNALSSVADALMSLIDALLTAKTAIEDLQP